MSELFEAPRGRSPASLIWRWGVVLPVTLVALAGGALDVVTSTVDYWYLLAPSYLLIAVLVWRRFPGDSEVLTPDDNVEGLRRRPITVGSVIAAPLMFALKVVMVIGFTFIFMVVIWAAIAILTWLKPFWYFYVPALLAIAGLVWWGWRYSQPKQRAAPARGRPRARRRRARKPSGGDVAGP